MDVQDPRLRSLLRQADKVADAGKRAAAEQLYRQIIEEASDLAEAWFGLGRVLSDPAEQQKAYQRSLAIKADYAPAARALATLKGEPVPEWAVLPKDTAVTEPDPEPEPEPVLEAHAHTAVPTEAEAYELFCYRHPNRATSLRCYNCGKPICSSCAIKTPVGYSCPDCIREKEDIFFNAKPLDYLVAPGIGLVLSLVAGYLLSLFALRGSFLIYIAMVFIGGIVGRLIGRFSKQAIERRRGRYLPQVMVAMLILGTAVWLLPIIFVILTGALGVGGLLALLGPGIYLFVAGGALFSYMK